MTFLSALLLGLLGSAHCAGMCGGLQSVLQPSGVIRSSRGTLLHLLALNFGRLTTYLVMGLLFSMLGLAVIDTANIPALSQLTRYLTALILLMLGVQMLASHTKPLAWLEPIGAGLWSKLSRRIKHTQNSRFSYSYVRGSIWGFLPCGLVYGVLVTTMFTDSVLSGMQIMLGFGLGTLPAMVFTGGAYQQIRKMVHNRGVQVAGGLIFIQGGGLMLAAPWFTNTDFMLAYPQVMNTLFCLS